MHFWFEFFKQTDMSLAVLMWFSHLGTSTAAAAAAAAAVMVCTVAESL